jgi:DNA mismatch repair protein PMS2
MVVQENMSVFEANGFKLSVHQDAPPGQRVKLLSVPFSKSVQFGPSDVRELACMIADGSGGGDVTNKVLFSPP